MKLTQFVKVVIIHNLFIIVKSVSNYVLNQSINSK